MNTAKYVVLGVLAVAIFAASVSATQLGVNYYHETMVGWWGKPYIPRTMSEVGTDMNDIKTISNNVKFFMNPFMNGNLAWVQQVNDVAKQKGMRTVVTMMVDDRQLDYGNWDDYSNKVVSACSQLNGKTDEILVGNEITLHSPLSRTDIKNRVVSLMDRCKQVYGGAVSYQEFWYANDVWAGYPGKIYFMHYENLDSFKNNVAEMQRKFGSRAAIGEWGEDQIDEGRRTDESWQKYQYQERWKAIEASGTEIAYIFAYREPSPEGFGMLRGDGSHKPLWDVLPKTGSSTPTTSTPTTSPTTSVPAPTTGDATLRAMATSCTASGTGCWKKTDVADNTCRYVTFGTNSGDIKMTACKKPWGGIEIYRNAQPSGLDYKACFDSSCVTQYTGFVKYSTGTSTPTQTTPATTPTSPTQTRGGNVDMDSLSYSCKVNGAGCTVKSDDTNGACRTIQFGSNGGDVKVQACDKGSGYVEMYRQQSPSTSWQACIANGCLDNSKGFTRFQVGMTSSPTLPTTSGVNGLQVSATPNGNIVGDYAEGTACRKVQANTGAGYVEARICNKGGNNYEMYLLSPANDANVCVASSCVGRQGGFASFSS